MDRARARPFETVAAALAWTTMALAVSVVVSPWLADTKTLGISDWDVETSHRYLTRLTLLRYGEAPLWNPYACGGFPAWAFIEGGTIVVSPWLLPYLVLPMALALRVEVIGMALIASIGAYALAGRFTRSFAARAFVVAIWAVNGRWALQTAAGHTWHLAYAWMPWCFYFFERAREGTTRPRFALVFGLAACFAMLVYSGGIYPLPHTVLALALYATAVAVRERSARAILVLAASGVLAIGLAAPKLLPMLETFKRAPRTIESQEILAPRQFWTLLTLREQTFHARPFRAHLAWHEYGMYLSVAGLVVLALAILFVWGRGATELKLVGLLFVALGFGAFHKAAPWSLLHAYAPFFKSQHVPFRFLYPAVLLLGLVAASGIGRLAEKRRWLDAALAACVLVFGIDVALVARKPMKEAMRMVAPPIDAAPEMHFDEKPPYRYRQLDWVGPLYLAMLGNRGVIQCYGTPPFEPKGARSVTDPRYRGEAYVVGNGAPSETTAQVEEWSPNRAVIALQGATAGSLVVYNMNYDDGWRSDAGDVVSYDDKVAVRLRDARDAVTFVYRPTSLIVGTGVGIFTCAACAFVFSRQARRGRKVASS
jgi:hypothetical protein